MGILEAFDATGVAPRPAGISHGHPQGVFMATRQDPKMATQREVPVATNSKFLPLTLATNR
jgi:hypothetical protein